MEKNQQKITALITAGMFFLVSGCAYLQNYKLDPSGSCLFVKNQSGVTAKTESESSGEPQVGNPTAVSPFSGTTGAAGPVTSTSETTQAQPYNGSQLPGGFGSTVSGTGGVYRGNGTLNDNFANSAPPDPVTGPAVILTPKTQYVPINSEVIVVASYLGKDNYLRTNEVIEWSLDGAGHVLSFDTGSWCDWLHSDFTSAKMKSDRAVITKTSANLWTIDRGTTTTKDDVDILKGQTWITVKSEREGASYISALAPSISDWSKRSASSVIYWVDAQIAFPRTSVSPSGDSRKLTTIVTRSSNGAPRPGWIVEYEIVGGPAAGLGESKAQKARVQTDENGQANVEIFQNESLAGTTNIAVKVIRPASAESSEGEVVIGSTVVKQNWTTGGSLYVKVTPPQNPVIGQPCTWGLRVTNSSSSPTPATLRIILPNGVRYVRADYPPVKQNITSVVQWELENIPARGSFDMNVELISDRGGMVNVDAQVFQRSEGFRPVAPEAPNYPPNTTGSGSSLGTGGGTGLGTGGGTGSGSGLGSGLGAGGGSGLGSGSGGGRPGTSGGGSTGGTGSSGGTSYGGISMNKPDVKFFIGDLGNTGSQQLDVFSAKEPFFKMGGEKKWVVLSVTNTSTRDLRDVRLVIYPPQEGSNESNAISARNTSRDLIKLPENPNAYVKDFANLAPGREENGKVTGGGVAQLLVGFAPEKPAQNITIIAEVFVGRQKLGTYRINTSVQNW